MKTSCLFQEYSPPDAATVSWLEILLLIVKDARLVNTINDIMEM